MAGGRLVGRDGALILASAFFYITSVMTVNPLVAGYTASLGATSAVAGLIAGAMSLCSLACRPIGGNLSDRFSRKRLGMFGATLMVCSSFGYALANTPELIGVLRVLNGIGYSLSSVCVSTWFAGTLPKGRIGAGMGVFGLMNALSMAAGPSVGIALQGTFGYGPAMLASSLFALCSLVCMLLAKDNTVRAERGNRAEKPSAASIELVSKAALPAALSVALFTIPYCAVQSFLVQYVGDRELGVTTGLYFPIYSAALIVLRLGLKNAFDSKPYGLFVVVSAISEILALSLLAVMHGNAALVAAAVFMAGGYGVMCSVSQAAAVRLAGPGNTGLGNSTYYIGFDAGMMLGPAIGGALYGSIELRWLFPAFIPVLLLAVVAYVVNRTKMDGASALS